MNANNINSFGLKWKLMSGFFYSFSSAMTDTQSVVLGKTLAIVIRGYAAGKILIFSPLDLFILFFIVIVFLSFLVTFAFWLYRRTESMVLFDTVFIAPLNQVMWLTFSTVAGGIYFHEFENASHTQWVGLISGLMLNYLGLYHLVPSKQDQPILIINMEKPLKPKCEDQAPLSLPMITISNVPAMPNMDYRKEKQSDDFEYQSDSVHSVSKSQSRRQRYLQMMKLKSNKSGNRSSRSRSRSPCAPMEILIPDDSDVTDD